MEFEFLSMADVLNIHSDQIELYGGSDGIRDTRLLESALGMPKASFGGAYLHADLFEMASAYMFHIVQNHPFIDGNKRTGGVAAASFLMLNGHELRVTNEEFEAMVVAVATGAWDKPKIAEFLRANSHKHPS